MDSQITFVLTSCGRFDLLEQTLSSFLSNNTAPIARYIIVEDAADSTVVSAVAKLGVKFDFLINDPPAGQLAGIDRAYATIVTPYVFHCEDDWLFFRPGFIEESRLLLDQFPNLTTVACRRLGQNPNHDKVFQASRVMIHAGVQFRHANLEKDPIWGGYSFNPGLRRLADYRQLGRFTPLRHEAYISRFYRQLGKKMAALEHPACETIGWQRHVEDRQAPPWRRQLDALYRADPITWNRVSRNEPCRCGSGKKFKHCHGALTGS